MKTGSIVVVPPLVDTGRFYRCSSMGTTTRWEYDCQRSRRKGDAMGSVVVCLLTRQLVGVEVNIQ